jgi:hypothetical protein
MYNKFSIGHKCVLNRAHGLRNCLFPTSLIKFYLTIAYDDEFCLNMNYVTTLIQSFP